ncbi:hypothetical protein QTG54_008499 [Skeletonema marinoi]|uniref:Uncharacterized protein n=1 Tax=Skeletonema marinoi TaxID=267567 RepID=A0AAD8Y7H6_9STRA|nr:hypothetical protein QTG54_008499 [Skeletonema marinoi]
MNMSTSQQFEDQLAALPSKPSNTEGSSPRPSWNCVMDIDNELDGCAVTPSILLSSHSFRRRQSSVSFSPTAKLNVIEGPDDYVRESYTKKDEALSKKEAREQIIAFLRLKNGSGTPHPHDHSLCLVGIEQYLLFPNVVNQRARARALVTYDVLREQARVGGCVADKAARIAVVSSQCTEQSALQAKLIGEFQQIQSNE